MPGSDRRRCRGIYQPAPSLAGRVSENLSAISVHPQAPPPAYRLLKSMGAMHSSIRSRRSATSAYVSRRRAIASLGAITMHARRPGAARRNGAKGGIKTAQGFADGPSAWGKRMALARWHGVPFAYRPAGEDEQAAEPSSLNGESRAPTAGPGKDGGGAP